jgi:hypothetical protein
MKTKSHKRGAPNTIQVTVSDETRAELKKLKGELGLSSVDSVIKRLLAGFRRSGEPSDADPSPAVDAAGPEKKRRIDVREPLYSFEVLKERRDMLEYYTGLDESTLHMLMKRLEVRERRDFFFFVL